MGGFSLASGSPKALLCGIGDGGEKIDEVPFRVTKEEGTVAPGHRGRRLHYIGEGAAQSCEHRVDVINKEFDDSRMIRSRPCGAFGKQLDGPFTADSESAVRRGDFGEVVIEPPRWQCGDGLVESYEPFDVTSDESNGNEVHAEYCTGGLLTACCQHATGRAVLGAQSVTERGDRAWLPPHVTS